MCSPRTARDVSPHCVLSMSRALLLAAACLAAVDAFVPARLSGPARVATRGHLTQPILAPGGRLSTRLRSVDDNDEVAKLKDACTQVDRILGTSRK